MTGDELLAELAATIVDELEPCDHSEAWAPGCCYCEAQYVLVRHKALELIRLIDELGGPVPSPARFLVQLELSRNG